MRFSRNAAIAVAIGITTALYSWAAPHGDPRQLDFYQVWYAARVLAQGRNPYEAIGPGREYPWLWPFYYPLPAAVVVTPLAPFDVSFAYYAWSGLTSGILAYALVRYRGQAALWMLASGAMVRSVARGQWAPILTAAFLWAPLRFIYVAKPTAGAALFAASPTGMPRRSMIVGVIIVGISFLLFPRWPVWWLEAVRTAEHFTAPIARTIIGALAIPLVLTRWRRPEARLVFAMACVPQTPAIYETLPVLLSARRWPEYLAMTVLSSAAEVWISVTPANTMAARWARAAPTIVYAAYLPAVALILSRPNEGHVPTWLERRLSFVPQRLRGRTPAA